MSAWLSSLVAQSSRRGTAEEYACLGPHCSWFWGTRSGCPLGLGLVGSRPTLLARHQLRWWQEAGVGSFSLCIPAPQGGQLQAVGGAKTLPFTCPHIPHFPDAGHSLQLPEWAGAGRCPGVFWIASVLGSERIAGMCRKHACPACCRMPGQPRGSGLEFLSSSCGVHLVWIPEAPGPGPLPASAPDPLALLQTRLSGEAMTSGVERN